MSGQALALGALLGALGDTYAAEAGRGGPGAKMAARLAKLIGRLDASAARPVAAPAKVPACALLARIFAHAEAGPAAAIGRALGPLIDTVNWVQTYSEAEMGARFLANYGYFDIASPNRGLIRTDALALGFLLLGPGTLYPAHRHPAVELYHVVAGSPDWRVEDGPWEARPAGSFIFHRSMAIHAMRTGPEPLLALYAWLGDLATAARLTG